LAWNVANGAGMPDTVRLGEVLLVAHHTPGHTRGATTWETTLVDNGRADKVAWPDGGGFIPGYRIAKDPTVVSRHQCRLPSHPSLPRDAPAGHFLGAHAESEADRAKTMSAQAPHEANKMRM
jgi:hypothetical protein